MVYNFSPQNRMYMIYEANAAARRIENESLKERIISAPCTPFSEDFEFSIRHWSGRNMFKNI